MNALLSPYGFQHARPRGRACFLWANSFRLGVIGILFTLRVWAESAAFPEYQDDTSRDYLRNLARTIEDQAGAGAESRLLQARIQQQLGRHDEAERLARECLAQNTGRAEIPSFLAHLCIRQDRLDEAAKYLRLALELNPRIDGGYRRLGMVLDRLGDRPGARAAFEQAVRQTPDDATARLLLGRILLDLDKAGEAVPYLEKACRLNPSLANAFYVLAEAHTRLGNDEAALRNRKVFQELKQREKAWMDADNAGYDDAREMRASVAGFHADAAALLMSRQLASLAEAHLRQAIQVAPNQTRSYEMLAELCLKNNRASEARSFFEDLARLRPTNAVCQLNLSTLLLQLKDYPAAVAALRRTLELDPKSTEALNNLARFYLSSRQEPAEALSLCRRLLELKPSAANYDLLGWALYANSLVDEARAASAKAVEKDPDNPVYRERQRRLQQLQ